MRSPAHRDRAEPQPGTSENTKTVEVLCLARVQALLESLARDTRRVRWRHRPASIPQPPCDGYGASKQLDTLRLGHPGRLSARRSADLPGELRSLSPDLCQMQDEVAPSVDLERLTRMDEGGGSGFLHEHGPLSLEARWEQIPLEDHASLDPIDVEVDEPGALPCRFRGAPIDRELSLRWPFHGLLGSEVEGDELDWLAWQIERVVSLVRVVELGFDCLDRERALVDRDADCVLLTCVAHVGAS